MNIYGLLSFFLLCLLLTHKKSTIQFSPSIYFSFRLRLHGNTYFFYHGWQNCHLVVVGPREKACGTVWGTFTNADAFLIT
jgi:hypothetical protein